jgi:hypothetical protein
VVIKATDSTGQGMVVIDGNSESLLENVVFENLSSPAQRGWQLTGAVTFYQSPVVVRKCHFLGARCEDAFNVIRSTFRIEECLFENSTADALDADFTGGEITNSSFVRSGNDAMDVSGTVLRVEDVMVKDAGDKAISIGEASQMSGKGIVLDGCEIAVAAKDGSQIHVAELTVKDCRVGFCAFQKKPEFSGAQIDVNRLDMINAQEPYLIQIGSDLKVDGESRGTRIEQVEELLYGVQYGKASR